MGKKGSIIWGLFLALVIWMGMNQKVSAAIELNSDDDGNITWTTTPTIATSGTKWRTQGFLVYATETTYGYPMQSGEPYGKILVNDDRVSVETDYDREVGKYISTFSIDAAYTKSIISNDPELYAQFKENAASGQACIYFNNFFQSYRVNGDGSETILTSNMYDIDSIRNNQGWANKNEWNTGYYNIKVPYRVTSNVHIKLVDSEGNNLGTLAGFSNPAGVEIRNVVADGVAMKNPSLSFYNRRYDPLGLCNSSRTVYVGDTVSVSLPLQVVSGGKTYELYRSYYYQTTEDTIRQADTRLKNDRTGTITKKIDLGLLSARIVGRYKELEADPVEPEAGETMEGEFTEVESEGVIGAVSRFDVLQGIPSTEPLYTRVTAPRYLAGYRFTKKTGTKTYTARGTITWNLTWEEGEGEEATTMTGTQVMVYEAPVTRTYSYWEISNLEVYGLSNARVNNGAFSTGSIQMIPSEYVAPMVSYMHNAGVDDHVRQPDEISQLLNLGTMSYNDSAPPVYDATALLNAVVGECNVKNDSLVFDGQTIMSAVETKKVTPSPGRINTEPGDVSANTLYATGISIPASKANGSYGSSGTVTYGRVAAVNSSRSASLTYSVEELNSVTVHTPVVCEPVIEDEKAWCQSLEPTHGYTKLILHTVFRVSLPTAGDHRSIPGYGSRDYGRYTAGRQVKFPFDVYKGSDRQMQTSVFVPAGTWTDVGIDTAFYLPPWVREGKYIVEFRSTAINAAANGGTSRTEMQANLSLSNYAAVNTVPVEVSGRLYGFELYDISDYPIWEKVFRNSQNELTGTTYMVGTKDECGQNNGQEELYTLPIVNGSNPNYINQGVISTGYVFRFRVKTIGDYDGEDDYIRITPRFYFVNKDGSGRQEVDIYYSERFRSTGEKEELVRIGSARDQENRHLVEGTEVFTFSEIRIPDSLMSFTRTELPVNPTAAGKNKEDVAAHIQTWHGKYYLPREIHVCPKDFDLHTWYMEHGAIDYQEEFWLKNGYVMINFDIETIQDSQRTLSYINEKNAADGYCNMWQLEGGISRKTDFYGGVFEICDGDVVLYDTEHSVDEDYRSDVIY